MSFKSFSAPFVSRWFLVLFLLVLPVSAQDTIEPNPADLATRLLGYDGEPIIPDPSPLFKVGDTLPFWVSKAGQENPVQITAELAGIGANTYVWVEEGVNVGQSNMAQLAGQLGVLYDIMRIRGNYGVVSMIPEAPSDLETVALLPMPDVDNDPHLYILYASDLNGNRTSVYNPANSLESNLVAGGYSNQHEMVIVNTSNFPGVPLDAAAYVNVLARQLYATLAYYNNPTQPAWLREATAWNMLLQIQQTDITANDLNAFFGAPDTPLTRLPSLTSSGQEFGAGQLFLRYVLQRFGFNVFAALFTEGGSGLSALDQALAEQKVIDLVTGDPVTAQDVFADFVMANVLNRDFGDGRYVYLDPVISGLSAALPTAQDQFDFDLLDQPVNQLATNYVGLQATQPAQFTVFFSGQETVSRLAMPSGDTGNRFYWSGDGVNRDATMTRAFDLSNAESPTLTFDAWYTLAYSWNYAYVEVSSDDGVTWEVLPASSTTTTNTYALAYGAGFTGISNAEQPRPFPYLGIGLDTNGITITQIVEDGPLAETEIQPGDTIAGHTGEAWEGQPNLLAFLADYEPGDTVNLYMQRGNRFFDVAVVLGEHPTRRVVPDAIWMPQTVDLSDYTGQAILLRFEAISLPGNEDNGIAIDNLSIPEIGFADDAESGIPGWTLNGWQQTTNQVRQQFVVQAAVVGEDDSRTEVTRLISPSDRSASGSWDFSLEAGETLVLAVSGANDDTSIPALYSLSARPATN